MAAGMLVDDLYLDLGESPQNENHNDHERPRELLTAVERGIIEECAQMMERIRGIMHPNTNVVSLLAFNQHIFAVQRLVMSNAAARAYPGMYKLLGED